jgi:hypothetical protein
MSQTLDGVFHLEGRLDPEAGAMVTTALNALSAPRPDDRRTAPQRRQSSTSASCRRQLQGGGLPQVGGQRPHLWVMVPQATLRGEPGSTGAEMGWAGPVIGELARRLACDSVRTEVALDSSGDPVEVGRPVRTISAGLPAAHGPGQGLRIPAMQRSAGVVRRSPHHLRVKERQDEPEERGAPLPIPPSTRSRRWMADLVGSRPRLEAGGGTASEGLCAAIDGSVWSAWAGHEQPAQGWAVPVRYMATVSGIAGPGSFAGWRLTCTTFPCRLPG